MLEFSVVNQIITRKDSFEAVANSRNYLSASFTFSEEWSGEVTAIFGYGGEYFSVLLEEGGCTIPWEVIKAPFFTVSVVCGDRITANSVTVSVEKSGYIEGRTPKEPTPDVYAQILNSAKAPYVGENKNWYVWDVDSKTYVDSGILAEGIDGFTPQRDVDYWTEADKTEIKAWVDQAISGGAW